MALKKSQLYSSLWSSCDELRGGMDALQYKDHVLSDMDNEIAELERRRDKTKAIKQGMMQVFLTGRTRLVEPGAEDAA